MSCTKNSEQRRIARLPLIARLPVGYPADPEHEGG
jgi:hypothetical protein